MYDCNRVGLFFLPIAFDLRAMICNGVSSLKSRSRTNNGFHFKISKAISVEESNHEFISKEYISLGIMPFEEPKSKATRAYTQRRTILDESIIKEYSLHWYEIFWGNPKQSHESLCSRWTISPLWRVVISNMVSESYPKLSHANRISSNVEQDSKRKRSRVSIKGRC